MISLDLKKITPSGTQFSSKYGEVQREPSRLGTGTSHRGRRPDGRTHTNRTANTSSATLTKAQTAGLRQASTGRSGLKRRPQYTTGCIPPKATAPCCNIHRNPGPQFSLTQPCRPNSNCPWTTTDRRSARTQTHPTGRPVSAMTCTLQSTVLRIA